MGVIVASCCTITGVGEIFSTTGVGSATGGGVIDVDLAAVSRSQASPGSTWYAGALATDGGNNSGWSFTEVPSGPPVGSMATLGTGK